MKKVFRLFIFAFGIFAFLCTNAYAVELSENEVIARIKASETKAKETIELLTNWSNSYASSLKSLFNREFVDKIDSIDVSTNIDIVIDELKSNGNVDAANALTLIKNDLVSNYSYIEETLNITENYLVKNSSGGTVGSIDLFIQIRSSAKSLKTPVADLLKIYYELDYADIKDKISEYDTVDELMGLYDYALEKADAADNVISKLKTKLKKWQEIYNMYNLADYNDLFYEYFGDYYNKARDEYDKLYSKLESKLQKKLDDKINVIVDETDLTDYGSVMNRNTKLYDIMDYINEVKEKAQSKFEKGNSLIEIQSILTKVRNQQTKIINRLEEAIDYTETYIIDFAKLITKDEADQKYINIDYTNGIIIYNQQELDANAFVNRLFATLGDIKATNIYGGKIGTLSKIELHYNTIVIGDYTIIVKGDIAPNAAFDITDVVKLCNKLFEKENLDEYTSIAADMNSDSKIDITDVVMLCNILFGK